MIDQTTLESIVIGALKTPKELYNILNQGISEKSFIVYPQVFNFVCGFLRDFNEAPTPEIIKGVYPDFIVTEPKNVSYHVDKLLEEELKRNIELVLSDGIETLKRSPKAALEYLLINLPGLGRGDIGLTRSYTDRDALQRLEILTKDTKQRKFIPSGISQLEDILCYQQGNMLGIVGRTAVGKSFLAIHMGCIAYSEGYKILFLSPELTCHEVNIRWDTVMSAINRNNEGLGNTPLTRGTIDLDKYREWLSEASARSDWVTYESYSNRPFTITSIGLLIEEHQPDVAIVDGLSLLRDEKNASVSWESVKNLSYGLKQLAINKRVAVIVTNQASREAAEETVPSLHHVSFGDAFAQATNKMIMLGPGDSDFTRYVSVPKNTLGKPAFTPILIPFDVENGRIGK